MYVKVFLFKRVHAYFLKIFIDKDDKNIKGTKNILYQKSDLVLSFSPSARQVAAPWRTGNLTLTQLSCSVQSFCPSRGSSSSAQSALNKLKVIGMLRAGQRAYPVKRGEGICRVFRARKTYTHTHTHLQSRG